MENQVVVEEGLEEDLEEDLEVGGQEGGLEEPPGALPQPCPQVEGVSEVAQSPHSPCGPWTAA